jgi:hypothetical protein
MDAYAHRYTHKFKIIHDTEQTDVAVPFQICFREVLISNFGRDTRYPG